MLDVVTWDHLIEKWEKANSKRFKFVLVSTFKSMIIIKNETDDIHDADYSTRDQNTFPRIIRGSVTGIGCDGLSFDCSTHGTSS